MLQQTLVTLPFLILELNHVGEHIAFAVASTGAPTVSRGDQNMADGLYHDQWSALAARGSLAGFNLQACSVRLIRLAPFLSVTSFQIH